VKFVQVTPAGICRPSDEDSLIEAMEYIQSQGGVVTPTPLALRGSDDSTLLFIPPNQSQKETRKWRQLQPK
jgi:hypothetical protein